MRLFSQKNDASLRGFEPELGEYSTDLTKLMKGTIMDLIKPGIKSIITRISKSVQ